jgi:hypothetical protein
MLFGLLLTAQRITGAEILSLIKAKAMSKVNEN